MGRPEPLRLPKESVAASDLVRHFGHWQRRAAKSPVYILHHGRPQFVLASIEFMQAVTAARSSSSELALDDLLDALADPVLVVDRVGAIVAAGRVAQRHFGELACPGGRLDDILPDDAALFITVAVARVAATGIAERTELPEIEGKPRLELTLQPVAAGVAIIGRPAGLADARDAAIAQATALAGAMTALPGLAIATIGPRGYLVAPDPSLSRLSGFAAHTLTTVRAANLFAIGSRVGVGDAIETVFGTGQPARLEADLLTADGGELPVALGLSPLRRGLATVAVLAVLAERIPN